MRSCLAAEVCASPESALECKADILYVFCLPIYEWSEAAQVLSMSREGCFLMAALNCNGHVIIYALGDCIHENMKMKNEACGSRFNDTEPVAIRR